MTTFEEREKAFEAKYRQDEEFRFKVNSRRNKLLGKWAAGLMGMTGAAVEAYAKEVVHADFTKPGQDDVVQKVLKDLTDRGVAADDHRIRREMERLLEVATEQMGRREQEKKG